MDSKERMGDGDETMSKELYACLHMKQFPLQSQLRLRPDLQKTPVAVLDGQPPLEAICSVNTAARRIGATLGMTRIEAENIQGITLLPRSAEIEAVTSAVYLECAANFSPRIEDRITGAHRSCVLDIAGTERLFGPPHQLAHRLREAFADAGLHSTVAVSTNFHTAQLKAAVSSGVSVVAEGQEAAALARLPLGVLSLLEEEAETFAAWGIRSLGELAALPEIELIARLGQQGKYWRDMAAGRLPHLFRPREPQFLLREYSEFEPAVEQMDSLLFVAAPMIESLASRASGRALLLASLVVTMRLDNKANHQLTIQPALPTLDRRFLLKLLHIELAAHPPPAAVTALTMEAIAGHGSKLQLGLFSPQLPEPSRLDVTLARIKAIVGADMVGSPALRDTNHGDAFQMEAFSVTGEESTIAACPPRMSLRRMRPPHPVQVRCEHQRPIAFHDGQQTYSILAAYGPWRTSGEWWTSDDWRIEEWDVVIAQEQQAYLLVNDHRRNRWYLDAVYD